MESSTSVTTVPGLGWAEGELGSTDAEGTWHPFRDTKKYRCGRCGEPKQGHVCKMVVQMEARGVQSDPTAPIIEKGCTFITVSSSKNKPRSRPTSLKKQGKHRRLVSDPFPLLSRVELPDFGLPDFALVEDAAVDDVAALDELFVSELSMDDIPPPPPPPPERSPRTPFFETSPAVSKPTPNRKGHRRIHSAPEHLENFFMPPIDDRQHLPRILDDVALSFH